MHKISMAVIATFLTISFIGISEAAANWYERHNIISQNGNVYLNTIVNGIGDIYIYSPRDNAYSPLGVPDKINGCFLGEPSLSPDGNKIAFLGGCDFPGDGDMESAPNARYRLTIIDVKTRKIIVQFDHAGMYSFSPDGENLAYAEETPGERGLPPPPGYKGGLWLYDFSAEKLTRIDTEKIGVMHINWSPHDGNIYISNNATIFKYDPSAKQGRIVDIPGIYFSNDGKYNLRVTMGGTAAYFAENREPVKYLNDSFAALGDIALFRAWAAGGKAILLDTGNGRHYVVGLSDGGVIKEFKGQLLGKNREGTKFLVHPMETDEKGRTRYNKDAYEIIELP